MLWGALKEIILVAISLNHSVIRSSNSFICIQTVLEVLQKSTQNTTSSTRLHLRHSQCFAVRSFLEIFIVTHTDSAATTIWHVYELNSSFCGSIWRKVCAEGCLWSASRHTSSPPLLLSHSHSYSRCLTVTMSAGGIAVCSGSLLLSLAGRTNGFVQQVCKGEIFWIVLVFLAWGGVEELN